MTDITPVNYYYASAAALKEMSDLFTRLQTSLVGYAQATGFADSKLRHDFTSDVYRLIHNMEYQFSKRADIEADKTTNWTKLENLKTAAKDFVQKLNSGSLPTDTEKTDFLTKLNLGKTILIGGNFSSYQNVGIQNPQDAEFNKRLSVMDFTYYYYSRTGEAGLNHELGQLGDAMDLTRQLMTVSNRLDRVMSHNPNTTTGADFINEDGHLTGAWDGQFNNIEASKNAYQVLQEVKLELQLLKPQFTGDREEAINNVLAVIEKDWTATTQKADLKALWENDNARRKVSDLITTNQTFNDINKQKLRKAMFLYQEFIKSAGSVMDRIFESLRGIASRISR
ncbi:hypothetical protein N9N03_00925 [Chlamydiia bacterium]|nr:hypothetical protein [Chlamydiia bacterium]